MPDILSKTHQSSSLQNCTLTTPCVQLPTSLWNFLKILRKVLKGSWSLCQWSIHAGIIITMGSRIEIDWKLRQNSKKLLQFLADFLDYWVACGILWHQPYCQTFFICLTDRPESANSRNPARNTSKLIENLQIPASHPQTAGSSPKLGKIHRHSQSNFLAMAPPQLDMEGGQSLEYHLPRPQFHRKIYNSE